MVTTTRKKRIARAVAVWINVAKSQLVKDAGLLHPFMSDPAHWPRPPAVFLSLLKELQDGLEADGLTEELEILNNSLSESIRSAILGKHTHSPILSGSLNQILGKVRPLELANFQPRVLLSLIWVVVVLSLLLLMIWQSQCMV